MPFYYRGDQAAIHYTVSGAGYPLLLLPAGGMDATIDFWGRTAFAAPEVLRREFMVIAFDARNAGLSSGAINMDDPWGDYADDHLGLMNHLGIDQFLVLGCCIGSSHALKLIERAPQRVRAAVLEQPTGIDQANQAGLWKLFTNWAEKLCAKRADLDMAKLEAYGRQLWQGDFAMSVSREFVGACQTPLLVLPGVDAFHPAALSHEIAALAPNAITLDPWKLPTDLVPSTVVRIKDFLREHAS